MMGELKLKRYPRLTVQRKSREDTYSSMDELTPVLNSIQYTDKYKTKHHRYLAFLKELQEKTKTPTVPGVLILAELKSKHRVSPLATKILIERHMLTEMSHGSTKRQYYWNTIDPNMKMVEKLLEDITHHENQKKEKQLVVIDPIAPIGFNMNEFLETLKYHLPEPEKIDYTKIEDIVKQTVSVVSSRPNLLPVPEIDYSKIEAILKAMVPQIVVAVNHALHTYLQRTYPLWQKMPYRYSLRL